MGNKQVIRYLIQRPRLMSRDKNVVDENGEIIYRRLSGMLGFQKRLELAETEEVVWQHHSNFVTCHQREFVNLRTGSHVTLTRKYGLHQTWFRFTYSGNNYIWKNSAFFNVDLKCYQEGSDTLVAEFYDKPCSPSSISIYPLPGWTDDFVELLVLTAIDMGESIMDSRHST
ncbi:hypothetical protein H4R33_006079 [Dimargaris cristalligena]|nr:hypothetical protein H4R33_006079 [Dimargaris cristalligena]